MKYILIITATFLLVSTNAYAQDFVAGPLLGLSLNQVDGDYYGGYHKAGVNVGGFVYRKINDKWSVQGEITYIQKGSTKRPNTNQGEYDSYKISLGYIQVPLVAQRHFSNKKFGFAIEAGISLASLLHSYEELNEEDITDVANPFETFDAGTILGVNYYFNNRVWFNFRFNYSITRIRIPFNDEIDIYDPQEHWLSRKPGQYNNSLIFSVFVALNRELDLRR